MFNRCCVLINVFVLFFASLGFAQSTAVEKGKQLYLSYGCALCHGKEGRGDGINAEGFDPFPTNFHKPKDYLHGSTKGDIVYSIKNGYKDNPKSIMPPFAQFTDEELGQLSSFLVSLQEEKK